MNIAITSAHGRLVFCPNCCCIFKQHCISRKKFKFASQATIGLYLISLTVLVRKKSLGNITFTSWSLSILQYLPSCCNEKRLSVSWTVLVRFKPEFCHWTPFKTITNGMLNIISACKGSIILATKIHACSLGKQWSHIVWLHFTGVLLVQVCIRKNNHTFTIISCFWSSVTACHVHWFWMIRKLPRWFREYKYSTFMHFATVDRLKSNTIHVNSTPNSHFLWSRTVNTGVNIVVDSTV